MVHYLTRRSQLQTVDCSHTVSLPAWLLEERRPYLGVTEMVRRIRQTRMANESTRTINR